MRRPFFQELLGGSGRAAFRAGLCRALSGQHPERECHQRHFASGAYPSRALIEGYVKNRIVLHDNSSREYASHEPGLSVLKNKAIAICGSIGEKKRAGQPGVNQPEVQPEWRFCGWFWGDINFLQPEWQIWSWSCGCFYGSFWGDKSFILEAIIYEDYVWLTTMIQ